MRLPLRVTLPVSTAQTVTKLTPDAVADLIAKLPARLRSDAAVTALQRHMAHQPVEIVHLIYRDKPYELDSKDYEFSRATVRDLWSSGRDDARRSVAHPEMLRASEGGGGVRVYDLAR